MKTIIAGSRDITDYEVVKKAIESCDFITVTSVISGGARGVDYLGEKWAKDNKIPYEIIPADWVYYKKRAGFIRNLAMARHADALIAIWDGASPGTKHMINTARKNNLVVFVHMYKG